MRAKAVAALVEAGHGARRRAATDDARAVRRPRAGARPPGRTSAWPRSSSRRARCTPPVKADESLAAYQAALDLARGADAERLRAHATLLCARYPGAFTRPDWREWAVAQIEQGLAGDAEQRDTFEVGALLIGRASMVRWFVLEGEELAKARRAAERAIEIAERIGSTQLLSHGLEALGWRDADHGFCDAARPADRMLEVVRRMPDRVEAAETLVIAAICLRTRRALRGRVRGRPRGGGVRHATSARTGACTPPRRRPSACSAPGASTSWPRPPPRRPRWSSTRAAGRARWARSRSPATRSRASRRSTRRPASAPAANVEAVGLHRSDSSFRYRGIEILRPFVGLERTRARIDYGEPVRGLVDGVHDLRAHVQLVALEDGDVEPLVAKARRVAREACAPPLGWIADWAEALRAGSLAGAIAATDALDAYGEHYTAARLMVDALRPDPRPRRRRGDRRAAARDGRARRARRSSAEARVG